MVINSVLNFRGGPEGSEFMYLSAGRRYLCIKNPISSKTKE